MSLNQLEYNMKVPTTLCPTDCRLRPDIRKLENGDLDGAATEKQRLEEKQREVRKNRKKEDVFVPKWFKFSQNQHTKQDEWLYCGSYWDRKYDYCDLDIF